MTANTTKDDGEWRLLSSQSLGTERDSKEQTVTQAIAYGRKLGWPAPDLEQLRLALSQAIQNVRDRRPPPDEVLVRLFVKRAPEVVPDPSLPRSAPGGPVGGWGFFLVQKSEENETLSAVRLDVVDLFLYQE